MVISDKPVQITEDGCDDDGVIFSDKAVVVRQDERPRVGQGQEEADLGARHRPGGERGKHQEELQQAPPLHHHQGQERGHPQVSHSKGKVNTGQDSKNLALFFNV